jgi:hypothetical protein
MFTPCSNIIIHGLTAICYLYRGAYRNTMDLGLGIFLFLFSLLGVLSRFESVKK